MTTQTFHAQWAWRGGEEAISNVRITVSNGVIASVEDGVDAQTSDVRISGVVMPGFVNAHSHAFHRALRGRTHGGAGDFWSWRTPMYEIANRLTPETYGELAAMTFAEMALSGITGVGEFHYIHHQQDGTRYANPNEMGLAMVAASQRAGIRMALLDVAYLHAGLDKPEPLAEQKRFSDGTIDNWLDRVDALGEGGEGWTVGMAPHSVRAVHPSELEEVVANRHGKVVHVHVSEQPAENAACIAATGKTPTQVLADAGMLGRHFTAVHATHLTATDISLLCSSHSGVCMCPTTERDLADGVGHPVADKHMAAISGRTKSMCPLARGNGANQFGRVGTQVKHLHLFAAGQGHQQGAVVPGAKHIGRQRAGFDAPFDTLRGQVHRHQLIAVLHAGVSGGALGVDPQMAGRFARRNALGQLRVLAIPAVNVDVVEPVGHGDEPLHVGRKPQVIGVNGAAHDPLHLSGFGIDKTQRIATRIGHEEDEEHEDMHIVLAVIVGPQQWADHDHRRTRGADDRGKRRANCKDCRVGGRRSVQVAAHHDAAGHGEQCQEQQDEGDVFHQRRVHQGLARRPQAARHHDGDQRQQSPEGGHLAAVVVPEVMRDKRKDGD